MTQRRIFISHRQSDLAFAQLVHGLLAEKYGATCVFLATEAIHAGEDFPDRLRVELEQSRVLLVVIGPNWLTATDAQGRKKLYQESDWVRKEIAAGLNNESVTVVPVLMDDTEQPTKSELPSPLRELASITPIHLRLKYLKHDIHVLIEHLNSSASAPAEGGMSRRSVAMLAFIAGIGVTTLAKVLSTAVPVIEKDPIECELRFASIGLKDGANGDPANRERGTDKCPTSGKDAAEHEMSSSNRDCAGYAALAADFNRKHANIKVVHKAYEHEWIKSHLAEFLRREDVPDVLVWSAGTHVEPYKFDLAGIDMTPTERAALKDRFMKHVQGALAAPNEDALFLPFKTYVWAFYYRPDIWEARNAHKDQPWSAPQDVEQLIALSKLMRDGNLEPIAFGNVHGWPALGYFDALSMRIASFDCHQKLLERTENWDQSPNAQEACHGLRETLKQWEELIPYYSANWHRRSYRDAAHLLADGYAGMFFIGGFFAEDLSRDLVSKLRAFEFPRVRSGARFTGVDAPIDGFVFPKKAKERRERRAERAPRCTNAMREFTNFLMTSEAYSLYDKNNPGSSLSVLDEYQKYEHLVQQDALSILNKHNKNNTVRRFVDREFRAIEADSGRDLVRDVLVPDLHAFLTTKLTADAILTDLQNEVPKL